MKSLILTLTERGSPGRALSRGQLPLLRAEETVCEGQGQCRVGGEGQGQKQGG